MRKNGEMRKKEKQKKTTNESSKKEATWKIEKGKRWKQKGRNGENNKEGKTVEIRQPSESLYTSNSSGTNLSVVCVRVTHALWDSVARTVSVGQHLSTSHLVVIKPLLQLLTQFRRVVDTAESTLRIMFGCSAHRMRSVVIHRGRSHCNANVETAVHQRH